MEFEVTWALMQGLAASANFAYTHTSKSDSSDDSAMAPERQVFAKIQWQPSPNWLTYGQLKYVGGRDRARYDSRKAIDDYTLVDVNLIYFGKTSPWSTSLKIANLLDSDAREPTWWTAPSANIPDDLPLAGRHFLIKFTVDFE